MEYTALHRLLGRPPGPIDDALLDEAVEAGLAETEDLDWKRQLPERKGLHESDYLKDVAAFANGRGGVIVYGVNERQRAATGRTDAGEADEGLERSLIQIPASHLHPSVLGIRTYRFGPAEQRAVAVVVPASGNRPHLLGSPRDGFRAPVRNGADTVWMSERDLEAAYRDRMVERRHASEALDQLYADAAGWACPADRAWGIAVVRPRLPVHAQGKPSRDAAAAVIGSAARIGSRLTPQHRHPLGSVDQKNLRPGLRRWVARNRERPESRWLHASASVYFDGAVTISAALGGHRLDGGTQWQGTEFSAWRLETLVGDMFGLVKAAGDHFGGYEYDVRLGIEWESAELLLIAGQDNVTQHPYTDGSARLATYTPVEATIDVGTDERGIRAQAREFATDCINQGGLEYLTAFDTGDGM